MPVITPHVCRHTFCSNMAKSGMNPKTLQYIMGHSDIGVTLNTYTHLQFDDAKEEMNISFLSRNRNPALPSIIGSIFGFFLFSMIRLKHSATSSFMGTYLTPFSVLGVSITYSISRFLWILALH